MCERANNVIATVIAKISNGDLTSRENYAAPACYHYNTKKNAATQKSPYELVYGREPNTWVMRRLREGKEAEESEGDGEECSQIYVESCSEAEAQMAEELAQAREEIRSEAVRAQRRKNAKNKKAYDARNRVREHSFMVGDKVLKTDLQKTKQMHGRLQSRWKGPYVVVKVSTSTLHLQEEGGRITKGAQFHLVENNML